jgi:hypothetical protein
VEVARPAIGGIAAARPWSLRAAEAVRTWFAREGLLVFTACAYGAGLLAALNRLLSTDGWLALVSGRLIARHGLPSQNGLTILGHGRPWIDQQWLAQLSLYGLDRAGGLRLPLLVHVVLLVAPFAGAMAIARRRGAAPRSVALVAVVALFPLAAISAHLRTESLAYVPFVALLAILTAPGLLSRRRLLLVFAVLALWANLHGSVVLAAALVALRGAVELRRAGRGSRGWRHQGWGLLALPWLALMASPYALSLPRYYASTVLNPSFGRYVAAWQPSTLSLVSLPMFALALGSIWLLGRAATAYTPFEKLALLGGVVLALLAVRNWVWLGFLAVALLPSGLDRARTPKSFRHEARVNLFLGLGGAVVCVALLASTAGRPQSWLVRDYPAAGARLVSELAHRHRHATIYATERYADWLLWEDPALAGRLAYDARFELLDRSELASIALFRARATGLQATMRRHEILVLDPVTEQRVIAALGSRAPLVYQDKSVVIVSRIAVAAGTSSPRST